MAPTARHATRLSRLAPHRIASSAVLRPLPARWNSTTATDPKINSIVNDISSLTLLQTAELVSALKTRLNIPDVALQSFAAAPAPAAPAAAAPEEPEQEVVQEKTVFNLRLQSFEPTAKPKVIKEVKSLLGLSLVDSKKFVESAPKLLKEGLAKEEAEKIQKVLQDLGAKVDLE